MSTFLCYADFGSGYQSIPIEGMKSKNTKLHNNLKMCVDSCTITFSDITTANLFNTTTGTIPIYVTKDGNDFFYGIVRKNFKNNLKSTLEEFKVEINDYLYRLQKKITSDLLYAGYKISDTSNKSASIIHQLLYEAGFSDSEIDVDDIDITIDYFVVDSDDKEVYFDVISTLMFEHGYVLYCDSADSGKVKLYDLFPTSITAPALTDSDIYHPAQINRQELSIGSVKITYYPHETKSDVIIFSDTSGGDDDNKCNIDLASGEYYPDGSDSSDSYLTYSVDEYEVIVATGVSLDIEQSGVTTNVFTAGYKKAKIQLYSAAGGTITQLDVVATSIVLKDTNTTKKVLKEIDADTEEVKEYTATYLYDKATADRLATGWASWVDYADFTYVLQTDSRALGEYYQFTEGIMSFDTTIRIIEIVEDEYGDQKVTAEGVGEYVASATDAEQSYNPPATQPENQNQSANSQLMSYSDDQNGYTAAGGTIVPSKRSILLCKGIYKAVALQWDSQINLTNFDHYEIQASSDPFAITGDITSGDATVINTDTTGLTVGDEVQGEGIPSGATVLSITSSTEFELSANATATATSETLNIIPTAAQWYDLQFDGTDWKGTLDAVTEWETEYLVHSNIPLTGDTDNPQGQTLAYRVRQETKLAAVSEWSDIYIATTSAIEAGDLAQNSIYANNIIASEIAAMLLRATEVWMGYYGTGTYDSPDEGDLSFKTADIEINIQEYTNEGWSDANAIKIGGLDSNNNLLSRVACRVLENPLADELSQEFLPVDGALVFNYENNAEDQNGDSRTVYNVAYSTSWKKFGTYSMFAISGAQARVYGSKTFSNGIDSAFGSGKWLYISAIGAMTASQSVMQIRSTVVISLNPWDDVLTLRLTYSGGSYYFEVYRVYDPESIADVLLTSGAYTATEIAGEHSVSFGVDFNDNIWLTVDNEVWTDAYIRYTVDNYNGTELSDYSYNTYDTLSLYSDEWYTFEDDSIIYDIFLQHYIHGVAWNTGATAKDLVPNVPDGGYLNSTNCPTKYYSPVSGEESLGTLHLLPAVDRVETTDSSISTTWELYNYSGYIPDDAKAVLLVFYHSQNSTIDRAVVMASVPSTDTAGATATGDVLKIIGELAAEIGNQGVIKIASMAILPVESGQLLIAGYPSQVPNVIVTRLWGYYI